MGQTMSAAKEKPALQPLHTVDVIETESQCLKAMERIMDDCSEWHIIGLYCEWHHQLRRGAPGSKMGNILIVSICTYRGYCALFRIDKLGAVPKSLKDLLESQKIAKTGVNTVVVVKNLTTDYGIRTQRYADIMEVRFHDKANSNPLTKEILNFSMDRDVNDFNHAKWSDAKLSPLYVEIAAEHVYRCLELYEKFDPDWFTTDLSSMGF